MDRLKSAGCIGWRRVYRGALGALLGTAAVLAASATAPARATDLTDVRLGDAPRRFESQDRTGWRPSLKAARTREQVVALYNGTYLPGTAVAMGWTGSIASCLPGTTSPAHQQAVIDRVNYYRSLVDLPPVTLLNGTPVTQTQASALMMTANRALSHNPPTSWLCYSADGAAGAGSSNLALGMTGVGAIDGYMVDPGSGNTAVGHRRWLLFPPRSGMATGDVPSGSGSPASNTLYVFGPTSTRPATPNGVAWPPAGFVPYQNLPSASNRWSLSYPGANFSSATVTMSGPGGNIPVTLEPIENGYGDNTIVFKPTAFPYQKPPADTAYTVTVAGIGGTGLPSTIQYTVTVIDPTTTSYSLSVSAGTGGTVAVSPNQTSYAAGTTVTLTATPHGDYAFASWSGDVVGNGNPVQIAMNGNRSIGATFAPIVVPTVPLPPSTSIGGGASGSVLLVPVVARTASFESEVFITNQTASSVTVNLRYHGARGTTAVGSNVCSTQTIAAQSTLALTLATACPSLPTGSQFGMLVISEAQLRSPLVAYSRTANPQGNGFSVEAYSLSEFSSAPATVTGLKRIAAGPPPFQSNCFVGALDEAVGYRIALTDSVSGQAVGAPVTGTLAAWESVRYLDIFGPAGAGAPTRDYTNVRADFSVVGAAPAALIGFCTVQDNLSFGADFRIAKSIDALDGSQARAVHVGHDGSGALTTPAVLQDLSRKHVWIVAVRHPDALSCNLAGPRTNDLEIRLREPGALGTTAVRAGGSNASGFAVDIGGRASVNAGIAGYWAIEVGFREGSNGVLPLTYGLTCRAGNGVSTPVLINPVGFADDF